MDATKQTLALKATCLLSAVLGFAAPITSTSVSFGSISFTSSSYLTKACVNGACTNYGGDAPDKQKAAIAFCAIALIICFVQCVLHFTAKPPNHALLGKLSLPAAFSFLISFSLIANQFADSPAAPDYSAGFAFIIIGWLASMGHFFVSNKAAASA